MTIRPVLYLCVFLTFMLFSACMWFVVHGDWVMIPFAGWSLFAFYRSVNTLFLHRYLDRMAREAHAHYERTRLAYVRAITNRD